MAKDSVISIPVNIDAQITDNDVTRLADKVWTQLMECMKEGFDQRLTAKMCEILLRAKDTAKSQGINFSISNPFHVKLFSNEEYEIFFEECVFKGFNDEECCVPAGAVYRVLECDAGVERVW